MLHSTDTARTNANLAQTTNKKKEKYIKCVCLQRRHQNTAQLHTNNIPDNEKNQKNVKIL